MSTDILKIIKGCRITTENAKILSSEYNLGYTDAINRIVDILKPHTIKECEHPFNMIFGWRVNMPRCNKCKKYL